LKKLFQNLPVLIKRRTREKNICTND